MVRILNLIAVMVTLILIVMLLDEVLKYVYEMRAKK